eukprot:2742095-Rhodomonas_salina.3
MQNGPYGMKTADATENKRQYHGTLTRGLSRNHCFAPTIASKICVPQITPCKEEKNARVRSWPGTVCGRHGETKAGVRQDGRE